MLEVEIYELYEPCCFTGNPVAEFSVLMCITPKFICNSDDYVPRILITENDTSLSYWVPTINFEMAQVPMGTNWGPIDISLFD